MIVYEYSYRRRKVADVPATITGPRAVYEAVRGLYDGAETERLIVAVLDTRNHVIALETVYLGNVSAALVRVGELFRAAVRLCGAGIVIVHNHPSGDPTPSPDDLHLTAEAIAAGRLLDIRVLDHLVIVDDSFVSLRDRGVSFERA